MSLRGGEGDLFLELSRTMPFVGLGGSLIRLLFECTCVEGAYLFISLLSTFSTLSVLFVLFVWFVC